MNKLLNKYNKISEPVKASIWYTICNVINKGIALLSTPIFTRVMTEEQYGTFTIFQSWYSIIFIFTSLNIFLSGYQKGLLLFENDRKAFTSSQLGLTTTITLFFGIIYLIKPNLWTTLFELPPILMFAMFLELLCMPALEFWAAKERFDFKYKKYVVVSIAMTILSLGGGVIAVINTDYKVEARVYTDVISKVIFAGILFFILMLNGKKIYSKKYWKYALTFNIPLIPHYLSNYVLSQSDRVMIGKMVGNDKAALYSVAYTISTMMILIVSAVNSSLTPVIYKKLDEYENTKINCNILRRQIINVTTPICMLIAVLCLVTMLFAPEVILIFAGKRYIEAVYVIPPVSLSVYFIFLYSMFSNVEYYYQKTKLISIATFISAVLNLVLNAIFIKLFGFCAAGYTTLVSYICLAIMHFIFYSVIIKNNKMKYVFDIRTILIISVFLVFIMILITMTYKDMLIRYGFVFLIMLLCFWKKNRIIEIIIKMKG